MSLYWPDTEAQIDLTQAGMHALVIGVGDYPHLMGGAGHPAVANFGLQQLTTTQHTARHIAEWLAARYSNPGCPTGSIELLLSPAGQVPRAQGGPVAAELASMANVRTAFKRWFDRCKAQPGNIALLYFCGHGISTASQYLLASDFGDPQNPNLWANCIDFDGLRTGMRSNAADTQLFFVDACREKPIDALTQLNPNGDPLCAASLFDQVSASAAYYAAADGQQAYGPPNEKTFFAVALTEALDGAGAIKKGGWVVDTFSLGNALGQIMTSLATLHNQPLTCNPAPEGKPARIHEPKGALVRTSIGCQTPQANADAEIHLRRQAVQLHSPRGEKRPWSGSVDAGDWDIELSFTNLPLMQRQETLTPPVFELELPV